jgi:hypothetical protein
VRVGSGRRVAAVVDVVVKLGRAAGVLVLGAAPAELATRSLYHQTSASRPHSLHLDPIVLPAQVRRPHAARTRLALTARQLMLTDPAAVKMSFITKRALSTLIPPKVRPVCLPAVPAAVADSASRLPLPA